MALRLQFTTIIVRREDFARCRNLPVFMTELHPNGGILPDETCWYDTNLWCSTTMSRAEDDVEPWEARGLQVFADEGRKSFQDICVAASMKGPMLPCSWLEFDPAENCVWRKGVERGPVIGGHRQVETETERLREFESVAEKRYAEMYESRHPKDEYEDASFALNSAIKIARFLHRDEIVHRLKARADHIQSVYDSQFRAGGPIHRPK